MSSGEGRATDAGPLEIALCESSDRQRFDDFAARIQRAVGGEWVVRLDGLDQRYWDLRVGGDGVSLHLEHFLGISLLAETPAAAALARRIAAGLAAAP